MPRYVDHELRRGAILKAALSILASDGVDGLTFRNLASKVGGSSTTVITHYYSTQRELIDDLNERLTAQWVEEIASIKISADNPRERLRQLLMWLVPGSDDVTAERARIHILAQTSSDSVFRASFRRWDKMMRQHLGEELQALVPSERVDDLLDLLRVFTGGVVLSVLEHPSDWPEERQQSVVDSLVQLVDMLPSTNPD
ncbi:TetR/AcrR family transcriptional regulator [Rhodococcoides kroppenstedtii]|uniref:TetR/AcrR family transcriptional regulator n=1 Tax=Rhodococcoides kroppenstedtii TaxID=293050 RepID=UPI0028E46A94|nr:TetR family transcriptional regulator C-terminal domain-containing protein [Rhodococcus kroppenstedtii]